MLRQKTFLILGAGASCDFNLPLGGALSSDVGSMLNFSFDVGQRIKGDPQLWQSIQTRVPHTEWQALVDAGRAVASRVATTSSIDDLLHRHGRDRTLVSIGKMAIASRILQGERKSTIFAQHGMPPPWTSLKDDWITDFLIRMNEGVTEEHAEHLFDNLTVLTFNYDRVLEHHLFHAVRRAYGFDESRAKQVMNGLVIHHAYGRLGKLPWEDGDEIPVPFGEEVQFADIPRIAKEIRTLTEREDEPGTYFQWSTELQQAEQVIFLGFGFHPQNIELLSTRGVPNFSKITASTKGLSHPDFQSVVGDLTRAWDRQPTFMHTDMGCSDMVKNYGRSWMSEGTP